MVNSTDFIERLEYLLDYYGINASTFADKIHVQRSSISHLLTGRNKPSLEFVLKVVKNFPEVNLYWLLNGKGSFPSEEQSAEIPPAKEVPVSPSNIGATVSDTGLPVNSRQEAPATHRGSQKTIDRIVIFYSDGSFEGYQGQ